MAQVIVISLQEEAKAIEALHKLNELESQGDISIYDKVMVRKNADGKCEILKEDSSSGWRALTGMSVGSLIGLIGGPVGFVVGLYAGTVVGAIAELSHYDFADDFVTKIENEIPVGTVAIIAEVDELSDVFIDTTLKPYNAVITRSDVDFEFDKYANEQIDEIDEEIADDRAALKKAIGDDRKKIQKKIHNLKEKRQEKIAEFVANAKAAKNSVSNEIKEERKDRIKRRIAKHEERLNNLNKQLEML
jgi:uncharacterized membrane protein